MKETKPFFPIVTTPGIDGRECIPLGIVTTYTGELFAVTVLSESVIQRALGVIEEKAVALGADAVIGLQFSQAVAQTIGILPFAIGTAVRFQ